MKHNRRPATEADFAEDMGPEPNEDESAEAQVCELCGTSSEEDGVITLVRDDGFTICGECVDELTNILEQVRREVREHPELLARARLN